MQVRLQMVLGVVLLLFMIAVVHMIRKCTFLVYDISVFDDCGCFSWNSFFYNSMGWCRIAIEYAFYFRLLLLDGNCIKFDGGIIKTFCSE